MASIPSAMSCEPCSRRRARPICGIIDDCPEADVQGTSGLGALVDWGEMEDVVQRLPSAKKPDWRRRPLQLMSGGAGRGGESSSLPHGAAWRWGCSLSPYSPSPGEPAGTRRDGMGRRRVRIPRRIAGQGGPASELGYFELRVRFSPPPHSEAQQSHQGAGLFFGRVASFALSVPLRRLCPVRRGAGARAGRAAAPRSRGPPARGGRTAGSSRWSRGPSAPG